MGAKQFDYYIFVDYSENLIGYMIIAQRNIKELLPHILRFKHYRKARNKRIYLKNVKHLFKREKLLQYFVQHKIRKTRENMEIFLDIGEFIKKHANCLIFASVDDTQFNNFELFVKIVDGDNIRVIQESELIEDTVEYQLSLVVDNWLNIERLRRDV